LQERHKGATAQREEDKGGQLEEAACLGKVCLVLAKDCHGRFSVPVAPSDSCREMNVGHLCWGSLYMVHIRWPLVLLISTDGPIVYCVQGLNEAMADKTSGTQGYALHGSLSLLPGFGPEGLLKNFSVNGKWWFTVLFCSWWSTVAMGVPSSLFPWTRFDIGVAHLTSPIAIIGKQMWTINYVVLYELLRNGMQTLNYFALQE
jgi:hypothetical protein